MKFADVVPDRWRTPPPHPVGRHDPRCQCLTCGYRPDHHTVKIFYDGLPLITLEAALLYVAEHPGWRLRKLHGGWRCIHD